MTEEEMDKEAKDAMDALVEFDNREEKERTKTLDHIEEIKSKKYRDAVNDRLEGCEATGKLQLVDISMIKGQRQEEYWDVFDHIYVSQTTDGGMIGDEYAGHIYIPITEKLYLKSYYSM